jgi:hypothetical protein
MRHQPHAAHPHHTKRPKYIHQITHKQSASYMAKAVAHSARAARPRTTSAATGSRGSAPPADIHYALQAFAATQPGQISVLPGDALQVLEDGHAYWWLVRGVATDEVGFVPCEQLEVCCIDFNGKLASCSHHQQATRRRAMRGWRA